MARGLTSSAMQAKISMSVYDGDAEIKGVLLLNARSPRGAGRRSGGSGGSQERQRLQCEALGEHVGINESENERLSRSGGHRRFDAVRVLLPSQINTTKPICRLPQPTTTKRQRKTLLENRHLKGFNSAGNLNGLSSSRASMGFGDVQSHPMILFSTVPFVAAIPHVVPSQAYAEQRLGFSNKTAVIMDVSTGSIDIPDTRQQPNPLKKPVKLLRVLGLVVTAWALVYAQGS
ncbi:hypothetical protein B0H12DRAFT_1070202 [Mycena haematopus]|nr:hypothetical protein B0H12DRAFT_1070202 [Mycena haematopus]